MCDPAEAVTNGAQSVQDITYESEDRLAQCPCHPPLVPLAALDRAIADRDQARAERDRARAAIEALRAAIRDLIAECGL